MTSQQAHSIKKIFIANRGEIARRIAQTAKRLGIQSVALTDRKVAPAYLSEVVSQFVFIEEESTKIYLNPELMIHYAKTSGADAVHPGFGFLSENAEFADAVIKAGLTWIGPNPEAIEAMASKATARNHAEKSKVPCLPGLNGLDLAKGEANAIRELENFAEKTGFPLLIKAAYGGGGKGMRIVHSKSELAENARRAAAEAISSFGNGSLIVEKYLPAPRHVEVQVMADKYGNVCIFGDRDCSLQRRHQKILEEAPAPNIPDSIRQAMHDAARNLTSAVGYDNAGTVEFLLDETNPQKVGFYFLEMNTRLQVEHTVTEEVFNVDLVELQIRVAQGESLPQPLKSLAPRGHSIEARIYAEDPGANFFPAPGPVRAFVPAQGKGIRWEIGMDTVDEISTRFDPMISKLVCTASTRAQALELMAQTLERTLFAGPRNNIQFLVWLVRHPAIIAKPTDTHFIAGHTAEALAFEAQARGEMESEIQEIIHSLEQRNIAMPDATAHHFSGHPNHHHVTRSAFAKSQTISRQSTVASGNATVQVTSKFMAWSPSDSQSVSRYGFGLNQLGSNVKKPFTFVVYQSPMRTEYWVGMNGHNWVRIDERTSSAGSGGSSSQSDGMSAPVPGKVIQVNIAAGATIEAGQILFVLESMKMQFEVKASKSGKAASVLVAAGEQVNASQRMGEWAE